MTDQQRIDILERAVSDLQQRLGNVDLQPCPATANLMGHTPLEELNTGGYMNPVRVRLLHDAGITSIERLASVDWTKRIGPMFTPVDMQHMRKLVDAWANPVAAQ